jgi:hypothetical protein
MEANGGSLLGYFSFCEDRHVFESFLSPGGSSELVFGGDWMLDVFDAFGFHP